MTYDAKMAGKLALLLLFATPLTAQQRPLSVKPDLRIDGIEQELVPVGDVAVGPAGEIALIQWQDRNVRLFNATGRPVETLGRKGSGPGEFQVLNHIGWHGDTLWVLDFNLRRITLFGPDRKPITRPVPGKAAPAAGAQLPPFATIFPRAFTHAGSFIAMLATPQGPLAARFGEDEIVLGQIAADGAVRNIIARYDKTSGLMIRQPGVGAVYGDLPFVSDPEEAVSSDGSRIAIVKADVVGKDKGFFRAVMLTSAGDTVYNRRHPFPQVKIPKRVADSTKTADLVAIRKQPFSGAELAALYNSKVVIPEIYPPLIEVMIGDDQTAWLKLRESASTSDYIALSKTGDMLGIVKFPPRTTVRAVRGDQVWVVEKDLDDVDSVVRYRILR